MPTKWYGVNFSSSGLIFVLRPYTLTECWSRVVAVSLPNPVFPFNVALSLLNPVFPFNEVFLVFLGFWMYLCQKRNKCPAKLVQFMHMARVWLTYSYIYKVLTIFLQYWSSQQSLPKSGRVNRVLTELTWVFPIPVKGRVSQLTTESYRVNRVSPTFRAVDCGTV